MSPQLRRLSLTVLGFTIPSTHSRCFQPSVRARVEILTKVCAFKNCSGENTESLIDCECPSVKHEAVCGCNFYK